LTAISSKAAIANEDTTIRLTLFIDLSPFAAEQRFPFDSKPAALYSGIALLRVAVANRQPPQETHLHIYRKLVKYPYNAH
jgi:hypothetical protein